MGLLGCIALGGVFGDEGQEAFELGFQADQSALNQLLRGRQISKRNCSLSLRLRAIDFV